MSDQKEYLDRCVDALDHIVRTARSSRVTSKRLSWIANRAESAINGDETWRTAPVPVNGESQIFRARARIQEIEAELTALRKENEGLRVDAERYRWLRANGTEYKTWQQLKRFEDDAEFDAFIDAARAAIGDSHD